MLVQAFLQAMRPQASQSFAGGAARRWLTANGLELPDQIVNDVASRFAPGLTPEEMLQTASFQLLTPPGVFLYYSNWSRRLPSHKLVPCG